MRRWFIECWHSGDADGGHEYVVIAETAQDAADQLKGILVLYGVDPKSVTFLRIASTR